MEPNVRCDALLPAYRTFKDRPLPFQPTAMRSRAKSCPLVIFDAMTETNAVRDNRVAEGWNAASARSPKKLETPHCRLGHPASKALPFTGSHLIGASVCTGGSFARRVSTCRQSGRTPWRVKGGAATALPFRIRTASGRPWAHRPSRDTICPRVFTVQAIPVSPDIHGRRSRTGRRCIGNDILAA